MLGMGFDEGNQQPEQSIVKEDPAEVEDPECENNEKSYEPNLDLKNEVASQKANEIEN